MASSDVCTAGDIIVRLTNGTADQDSALHSARYYYTLWAIKTYHSILDHSSHASWWIFFTSCINGKMNEYSAEQLQNLQLYLNCVSNTTKNTQTAHFELKLIMSQYLITQQPAQQQE